jgi:hypothetical protein
MSRQTPFASEFVSLTVMLLMIVALVAGQADATLNDRRAADVSAVTALAQPEAPASARIRASFEIEPLVISIDASAEVRNLIPDVR